MRYGTLIILASFIIFQSIQSKNLHLIRQMRRNGGTRSLHLNKPSNIILSDSFTTLAENESELIIKIPENCLPNANADITYMIADTKFNGTDLRILEFGEGTRSRFEGYDALHGKGAMWKQFWTYLASFNLPIYYVAPEMHAAHAAEIDYQTFLSINGKHIFNMYQAIDIASSIPTKTLTRNITALSDYSAIIVIRHLDASSPIIRAFKKRFPNFLILDSSSAPFLNNKYKTSSLFDNHIELETLRPANKLYEKKYTKELAQTICNDFPNTDILVIKPLTGCKGYGIIMVEKKDLDKTLYTIFEESEKIAKMDDTSYSYWAQDANNTFLIEQYERSKLIKLPNDATKSYDATLRMVFSISYQNETMHLKIFNGYWKLPLKAQEEEGSLTEKIKSKINPERASSLKLSAEDRALVSTILKKYVPIVYYRMLAEQNK